MSHQEYLSSNDAPYRGRQIEFILPDPDSHARGAGSMLPVDMVAALHTVRDVANMLVPEPICLEVNIERNYQADLHSYLEELSPIMTYAQSLEEEIVNAHDSGRKALIDLFFRRINDWEDFIGQYDDFYQRTLEIRSKLDIEMPNLRHIRGQLACYTDINSVNLEDLIHDFDIDPDDDGDVMPSEMARREQFWVNLESNITSHSADIAGNFKGAAAESSEKAPLRSAGIDFERDWIALHPWEGELPPMPAGKEPLPEERIYRPGITDKNWTGRPAKKVKGRISLRMHDITQMELLEQRENKAIEIQESINTDQMEVPVITQEDSLRQSVQSTNQRSSENTEGEEVSAGEMRQATVAPPMMEQQPISSRLVLSAVSQALLGNCRNDLLLELQRQMSFTGFLRRQRLEEKIDSYVRAVDWSLQEIAQPEQIDFLQNESNTLMDKFAKPIQSGLVSEELFSKLGYNWRHANRYLKIGLGIACGVAGVAGGPLTAAVGGGLAMAARGMGGFAIADTLYTSVEKRQMKSKIIKDGCRGLVKAGEQAWKLDYLVNQNRTDDQPGMAQAARIIQQGVRQQLRESAGLRQIVQGAARSARKRPFHLLGKLCVAGGLMWAMSTDVVKSTVGSIREKISGIFNPADHQPDLYTEPRMVPSHVPAGLNQTVMPVIEQSAGNSSAGAVYALGGEFGSEFSYGVTPGLSMPAVNEEVITAPLSHTLKIGNGSFDNCVNKVLRTPVLQEFARQGVDLDSMTDESKAKVLNAVANIAKKMQLGDNVIPGQKIELSADILKNEVARSLRHANVSGALNYVKNVDWIKWSSIAKAGIGSKAMSA